jgi:hypothetical protein
MKQMKQGFLLLGTAVLLLATSCRKDVLNNLTDSEARVYITQHDSTKSFSNYTTFRVADSVSVIQNGDAAGRMRTAYDSTLINAVRTAMVQRGFQLQTNPAIRPDIGVNVTRISNSYTGVVSYGGYWGDYLSYWDPYYWGYGGYGYNFPYTFGTYSYREGAVSIDMLDLKNPNTANNSISTIWTGLGRGTGIFTTANVPEIVDNLFNQATYLRKQ